MDWKLFKNDPDKSIETLADGGVAVLASEGIVAGCVEVTEAGASDANTSKPLDEKSDNRGYVRTSAGVGDEGLPDPEVYEAARRIDEERWAYRFAKRAFDIVFSATVLVLFCWLYALIAMAIKIDDPSGPVFFKQERVGKNGERFMMWKFRSMYVNAEGQLDDLLQLNEKTGPVFKISKDPRIASRIIDATARRSSFGPAVASVFPPKMTEISAVFSQVKIAISSLRNLLKNSFKNLSSHTPATTNFFAERKSAPISWGGGGLPLPCHCESMAA
ncbi:sugar transferase [Paraeggerthella hominis]|uniref:sugar transferase n=1 Tax=Paraeggerthella hominis TaxID=2897351 RepID=UPI001E2843E7|nr:sugar transferase [Paraeggerthella hominis]MCD2433306.1 sugar transferase [Paraeggerthella hominis]